jgi:hypothetical protein
VSVVEKDAKCKEEPFFFISLFPGACLREAASAKAGEREGVRGRIMR